MAVDLGYDESGSGDTLIISMQLGIVKDARKLKRKWRSLLKRNSVEYFHAVEYRDTSGVFGHLKPHERERLLQHLINLTRLRLRIGLSVKVSLSDYEQNTTHAFRSEYGTAYAFAINVLLLSAHLYMKVFDLGTDVNILVEGGHRNCEQALGILRVLQKSVPPQAPVRILTVGSGFKRDHPILQAADMLAYAEWQKIRGGDLTIYNHLYAPKSIYQPEIVEQDVPELVKIFTGGASAIKQREIEFGQQRAQEIELRKREKNK